MHPGGNITSNYARVEKKERANSGTPGSRESPLEKNNRKMEGKSGPPPKNGESHMRQKKEKRKGNSGPSGSRESHAEAKLRIRHPDDLPPMCRRENTHSTTTPDSSPMRGRTRGKNEECGRSNDGVFTPKQRARQLQQNFARGILPACIRPSQKNLSD